jgi:peptidyl-prolyl cis-trans isomerase D
MAAGCSTIKPDAHTMISFFRNILSSKLIMGLFALIMLAFIITGVGTGSGGAGNLAGGGTRIAKVGGLTIEPGEAQQRVSAEFDNARQQQPGLDVASFVSSGSVDRAIDQMISSRAFEAFAAKHGMAASQRLIDADIAAIPAFKGPTGQFDRNTFLGILSQRKLSEASVRADIARDKLATMLVIPAGGAARVPSGLVAPYASLLLEARQGQILEIPARALAGGAAPTQAEIDTFYARNTARYTVPETRVIRYAMFDRSRFASAAVPSEAELAAAYKAKASEYAGKETRSFTQIVVGDQASATALAAKVRTGTPMSVASKDATTLAAQDKAGYAGLSSSAVAAAAFAAKQGDVIAPVKSALGWHVLKVDKINIIAGKSLADVRGTLVTELTKEKTERLLADFVTKLDDAAADGSTFDDLVKSESLSVITTPPVTASGIAPTTPGYKAPPELATILKDAFQGEIDDDPTVIAVANGAVDVLYDLDRVTPATPRPLASIREQVAGEFAADRANRAAKKLAEAIVGKMKQGTPLSKAASGSGTSLPGPRPFGAKRIDLARMQGKVPAPFALLFSMARGTAKVLEAPDKSGWLIVALDNIIPGNAALQPDLVAATQQQMSQAVGEEYVSQFVNAIKADVGVSRNADAIATLKRSLAGGGGQQ